MEGLGDRTPGARRLRPRLLHPAAGGVPLNVESSIPQLFAEQAARYPDKPAIAGTSWQPTFAELDAASNRLAAAVVERNGGPGQLVAVLLRHDAPLIAALLAALKAGATAVVLDPRWPSDRLRLVREDLDARIVLVDPVHRDLAMAAGFPASGLVEVTERPEPDSTAAPTVRVAPEDVAFLIQTSGSTGRPKSVMQTHRNVIHNALVRLAGGLGLRSADRIVLLGSPSGGQGISTVWTTLLSGATLCPFPVMDRGVTGLPDWLAEQEVTVLVSSASLFRHFVRTLNGRRLPGIRLVRLGSEQVFAADFESFRAHFAEDCALVNSFSSSETGNITQHVLRAGDEVGGGTVPVGRPAAGMDVLLLDDAEVAVRSDYLSPGYWKDDELTGERFRDRIYRTGDLGRISEDGVLTVLGRKDSQVKVRGSRVDLIEVESALVARPGVAAAAVSPRPTARGETGLTAYVALQPGAARDAAALREGIRATLPTHAVPTGFAFVDALPLNSHGKVDRDSLASIEPGRARPSGEASPITETEELLAGIWADALERGSVSPGDDFFALEGDSLIAAEIAAAVHDRFGVEIELDAFAESPTVAAMAELIEHRRNGDDANARVRLQRAPRDKPIPCSLIQERTWRQSQSAEGSIAYAVAAAVRIRGALDVAALGRCIDRLVARHEILRTTFTARDGEPVQIVHPPRPVALPLLEVKGPAEANELLRREALVPFDLERGPLIRFLLLRLADGEHWLLRLNHHINSDGPSWEIFFDELATLYEADLRGGPPPLDQVASNQYADFAAWERRTLRPDSKRWRDDVKWWRAQLEGAPARTPLPFARRDPDQGAPVSDGVIFERPSRPTPGFDSLRRELGATQFMVGLSAFAALLAATTGEPDMVIGTYGSTRRLIETRDMFGFFANPITLRLRFAGSPSFRDWLTEVRSAVIEASAHAQTPYDALCDELRAAGTAPPEFGAIFRTGSEEPPRRFAGIEITALDRTFASMPWGFTLQLRQGIASERCVAGFDARLHEPRAVRSFLRRYRRLLARVCAEPDRPLPELIPSRWRRFGPLLRRRVVDRR